MDHHGSSQHHEEKKHGSLASLAFGSGDFSPTSHHDPSIQSFEPTHELVGRVLQPRMEMFSIPIRHQTNSETRRGYFSREGLSQVASISNQSFIVGPETSREAVANPRQQSGRMLVDDPSLRCLFLVNPGRLESGDADDNGLSQHFNHHQSFSPISREGLFSKPPEYNLQQEDARFFPPLATACDLYQQPQQLRSSKYLLPAQDLLNEYCSLGGSMSSIDPKNHRGFSSSSSWNLQSLQSLDVIELQKRKARLLSMLEEVDWRYKKYCEQMRSVVSGFETLAGEGTAKVYSLLALKAMSRHFRSLRDGIVGQIKETNKAMGEKDTVSPGVGSGETPRLRILDQCLRQQKAFQHGGVMENQPWRPQRGLPERSVSVLRAWLFEHFLHPYPSDVDKHILARQTGLSRSQVSNWFINARVRLWKPMVEDMYVEETKEQDNLSFPHGHDDNSGSNSQPSQLHANPNPNPSASQLLLQAEDQKSEAGQLLHNDSDSLSSIINSQNGARPQHHEQLQQQLSAVDLDFSSHSKRGASNQSFGSGVSLTLGLQQNTGGGMNLSFSPASQNSALFFSRENMDDCQQFQFAIIDGEAANLPYLHLMGAQLLRDLTG